MANFLAGAGVLLLGVMFGAAVVQNSYKKILEEGNSIASRPSDPTHN